MKTFRDLIRRSLFAAMALVLVGIGADEALAQRGARTNPGQNIERSMAYLTSELDLTEAQQTQIRPIMQAHMDRRQALFAEYGRGTGTPLGMRPEMQELRDETHSKVEAILNDAQQERYSELQQSPGFVRGFDRAARGFDRSARGINRPMRGSRGSWRSNRSRVDGRDMRGVPSRNVDRSMAYLTSELDLTEAQQTQIRPIMQAHMDRQQALFAEYGRGTGIPLATRPEMQELRNETHSKVAAILNDAQQTRYGELRIP